MVSKGHERLTPFNGSFHVTPPGGYNPTPSKWINIHLSIQQTRINKDSLLIQLNLINYYYKFFSKIEIKLNFEIPSYGMIGLEFTRIHC